MRNAEFGNALAAENIRRILRPMKLLACTIVVLMSTAIVAQGVPSTAPFEHSESHSNSYNETVRMLKSWLDSEENAQLALLFAQGDSRSSDLIRACQVEKEDVAAAAFLTLQLLGSEDCQDCGDKLSRNRRGFALSCMTKLKDSDFNQIEQWLAKSRTPKGYDCGDDGSSGIDDPVIYDLILDGSSRSVSLLNRISRLTNACSGNDTIIAETLKETPKLISDAKKIGHNVKIEPDSLEASVRNSAFFLPEEYRKEASVKLLARNSTDSRLLLEVSYSCGMLCGRGYDVVLRKDGAVWQYAVIRMAWIS